MSQYIPPETINLRDRYDSFVPARGGRLFCWVCPVAMFADLISATEVCSQNQRHPPAWEAMYGALLEPCTGASCHNCRLVMRPLNS